MKWNEKQKRKERFVSTLQKSLFVVFLPYPRAPGLPVYLDLFPYLSDTHSRIHLQQMMIIIHPVCFISFLNGYDAMRCDAIPKFKCVTVYLAVYAVCIFYSNYENFPEFLKAQNFGRFKHLRVGIDLDIHSVVDMNIFASQIHLLSFTLSHAQAATRGTIGPSPCTPHSNHPTSINLSLTSSFPCLLWLMVLTQISTMKIKKKFSRISDQFAVAFFPKLSIQIYGIRRAQYAERHIREHQSLL